MFWKLLLPKFHVLPRSLWFSVVANICESAPESKRIKRNGGGGVESDTTGIRLNDFLSWSGGRLISHPLCFDGTYYAHTLPYQTVHPWKLTCVCLIPVVGNSRNKQPLRAESFPFFKQHLPKVIAIYSSSSSNQLLLLLLLLLFLSSPLFIIMRSPMLPYFCCCCCCNVLSVHRRHFQDRPSHALVCQI
jgi:hypothetical protein